MSVITVILFFVYTYGLGYGISIFFKNSDNFFERNVMKIGMGLAVFTFLLILLDFFNIMIDWKIVLLLSLLGPLYVLFKKGTKAFKFKGIKINKSNVYFFIVLIIFFLTLFMYVKGSFIYPYFENDDPWSHAVGVKYISIEKNLEDVNDKFLYIEPYPPAFDALLAILHQTSPSIMWTIKFFNALFISLGIIFFFYFTKHFTKNSDNALVSTVILAMIPCFLSHFIWAHTLVITLLFVAMYGLMMIEQDKRWSIAVIIAIAAMSVTQPSQAIKFFGLGMIFFVVKSIYEKRFLFLPFFSIIGGYTLSLFWWLFNFREQFMKRAGGFFNEPKAETGWLESIISKLGSLSTGGTADRAYTMSDFFIAKSQNLINNPVGVGLVIMILLLLSLLLVILNFNSMKKSKKVWLTISIVWLMFTFFGLNALTFNIPIRLFPFRFWMLFAIPVSLIAAEGFLYVIKIIRKLGIPKIITFLVLVVLIFMTSGQQKYDVNTAMWGPGQKWASMEEVQGYIWLKTLPVDTKVFSYSDDEYVIGMDKFSCLWCDEVIEFRDEILYKNASQLHNWLRINEYEYLIIDQKSHLRLPKFFGENVTRELLPKRFEEISLYDKFRQVHQTKGMAVFRVI